MTYILNTSIPTAGVDYVGLTNYLLTFDSSNTVITVNVSIVVANDSVAEEDEEFTVSLSFPSEPIPRVTLNPHNATIVILEMNGEGMHDLTIYLTIKKTLLLFMKLDLCLLNLL